MKRVYIITGASSGIGKKLVEEYSKEAHVIGISRSAGLTTTIQLDISKDFDGNELLENINSYEEIVLLNCAGINYNSFLHKSDLEKWKEVISVNLVGTYRLSSLLTPIMRAKKFGRIINFSSVTAQLPTAGVSAYAASKSGLWGLAKSFAAENASKNVTMNNMNLGYTKFGMIEEVPKEYLTIIMSKIPTGELGTFDSIKNTIDYFVATNYVNGTSVDVNGGLL